MSKLTILSAQDSDRRKVVDGTRGLVTVSTKPVAEGEKPFGSVAIQGIFVTSNGNVRTPIAYLRADIDKLKALIGAYDLKAGDEFSSKMGEEFTIVAVEQSEPHWKDQQPLSNPRIEGNPVIRDVEGNPIYLKHELVPKFIGDQPNPKAVDTRLERLGTISVPSSAPMPTADEDVFAVTPDEETVASVETVEE